MPSVTVRKEYSSDTEQMGSYATMQCRLQAVTNLKVKEITIRYFLFANDCALNAATEQKMQTSTGKLSGACDNFGLTVRTKNTEVMYQPCPGKSHTKLNISVNGEVLNVTVVDKFTYLPDSGQHPIAACYHRSGSREQSRQGEQCPW